MKSLTMNVYLFVAVTSVTTILLFADSNGNEMDYLGKCRKFCNKYVEPKYLDQCKHECVLLRKGNTVADLNSCVGRCGENYDSTNPCHCNDLCPDYGNCCGNYQEVCFGNLNSCVGRCGENYDSTNPCHCNDLCPNYDNCCSDYYDLCSNSDPVTDDDLLQLGSELWQIEIGPNGNAVDPSQYTLNKQGKISNSGSIDDLAPHKLYTYFDETLLTKPTYAAFAALLDNYKAHTGNGEDVTSDELNEIETFLDEVMATDVMQKAHAFLASKGLVSQDATGFKSELNTMWFDLYSRSSGQDDSSGFEHVFVGEIKNGAVSGFHNWIAFYLQEKKEDADYYGYFEEAQPQLLSLRFEWSGVYKKITSFFHGTSPEFEMAAFTVCFFTRPDSLCKLLLDGNTIPIQTYTYDTIYVGSAYPSI